MNTSVTFIYSDSLEISVNYARKYKSEFILYIFCNVLNICLNINFDNTMQIKTDGFFFVFFFFFTYNWDFSSETKIIHPSPSKHRSQTA